MKKMAVFSILVVVLLLGVTLIQAQDNGLMVEPQTVMVSAADGLELEGDLYNLGADGEAEYPAVLLIHMLSSNRAAWKPLIPALLDGGYSVLNIDMRGHGQTGGARNWPAAEADIQTWLDWLRDQPGIADDSIAIIGGSIGSNLAIMGCANDPLCVTAIALSPGEDYSGVKPGTALIDGLAERSALLVASHGDTYSAESVINLAGMARGDIGLRIYPGQAHGTNLFAASLDSVTDMTLLWLYEHMPETMPDE